MKKLLRWTSVNSPWEIWINWSEMKNQKSSLKVMMTMKETLAKNNRKVITWRSRQHQRAGIDIDIPEIKQEILEELKTAIKKDKFT